MSFHAERRVLESEKRGMLLVTWDELSRRQMSRQWSSSSNTSVASRVLQDSQQVTEMSNLWCE
ncbi:hypothetical protein PHLCEN_2v3089 [Hermanssonia centrifuga]|uniref:Uncharacterized protein n=1 Tax=Hermanssonia centrifuga TaxID=98765 RepID=A0A2R6R757_9APHY|nr:hypothetical protein PHLCEN_2v3089 [Hermanssonia centrifuga]